MTSRSTTDLKNTMAVERAKDKHMRLLQNMVKQEEHATLKYKEYES